MPRAAIIPIVGSSNIAGAGYDEETRTLTVKFHHGRSYNYFSVPRDVYEQLMEAASAGQFFNSQIKNQYRFS